MIAVLNDMMAWMSYLSIAILVIAIIILGKKMHYRPQRLILMYFVIACCLEIFSWVYNGDNYFLIPVSGYINYIMLCYLYLILILQSDKRWLLFFLLGGILPVLPHLYYSYEQSEFHSYERVIYNICVIIFSLISFLRLVGHASADYKRILTLNTIVLLFLMIDLFLALGTNFLLNESLLMVAWFWLFRALFLQLYYLAILNFTWQLGTTR